MKNNKLLNKILLGFAGLFLLIFGLVAGAILVRQNQDINEDAAPASSVYLSPSSQQVGQNNNFNFNVKINTAENLMSGVDLRIKFDQNIFEIISLEKGQDISDFNNILKSDTGNDTGEIKYIAFSLDKSKAVHGNNLDLLKINAKVKNNASKAMYTIGFGELTAASGLTESTNIITGMDSAFVTVIDHTDTDTTYVEGEPNSCGGTCGSNYNCKANLYCYKGFCRNPICSDESDCDCSSITVTATAKATLKPLSGTATKTASPKSTSKSTAISKASPISITGSSKDMGTTEPLTRTTEELKAPENMFFTKYAIYIFASFVIISLVAIYFATRRNKQNEIPHIMPPTNI